MKIKKGGKSFSISASDSYPVQRKVDANWAKYAIFIILLVIMGMAPFLLRGPVTGFQTASVENSLPVYSGGVFNTSGESLNINLLSLFYDPDGDNLTFIVDDLAVSLDGGSLVFTPPSGFAGEYVVNVGVSDGVNTLYKPVAIVVAGDTNETNTSTESTISSGNASSDSVSTADDSSYEGASSTAGPESSSSTEPAPTPTRSTLSMGVSDATIQAACPSSITACCEITGAGNYTVANNISATGGCIDIQISDVDLNCQGFTINYSTASSGNGINVTNRNNVTVRNCNVVKGNSTVSSADAVVFSGTNNSVLSNVTVDINNTNVSVAGRGVFLSTANNNSLVNISATNTLGTGISISGNNNTINNSNGTGAGNSTTAGHGVSISGVQNTLERSRGVATNGSGTIGVGILASGSSNGTFIDNNATSAIGEAFYVTGGSGNILTGNNGTNLACCGHGIVVESPSNTLRNNRGASFTTVGLRLISSGNGNTLINNTGVCAPGGSAIGLASANNNVLINNTGNCSGGTAIDIASTTSNNSLSGDVGITVSSTAISIAGSSHVVANVSAIASSGTALSVSSSSISISGSNATSNSSVALSSSGSGNTFSSNIFASNSSTALFFSGSSQNNTFNNTVLKTNNTWISTTSTSSGNNITNTTFDSMNGSIRSVGNTTVPISTSVTVSKLNITNNSAFLNSSNLSFLNVSSQITLKNVTFTDSRPLVDFNDDGVFANCDSPQCTEVSFSGGTFIFNVSGFTTYSSNESGLVVTLTKTDNPDPVAIGSFLNYSITVNVTEGNASNVTVRETYPAQVIFNTSQPAPDGGTNNTFSLGNFSAPQAFIINITVNVSSSTRAWTLMNNTANVTFLNSTNHSRSVVVTESTTAQAGACPGTITVSTNLTNDVQSNGTCVTLGADNITFDCRGFTINYSIASSGNGIVASSRKGVTVRNCNVVKGNSTVSSANAVSFSAVNNSLLSNVTVFINNTNVSDTGVLVQSASNNNTIVNVSSTTTIGFGIIVSTSDNNIINNSNGTGAGNSSSSGYGIQIGGSQNTLERSIGATTSGTGTNGVGINIAMTNGTVTDNVANATGTGLYVTNSNGVIFTGNNGTPSIIIETSLNNTFRNNIGSSSTSYGFRLISSSNGNTFINNTGICTAAGGLGFVITSGNNNVLINNTANCTSGGIQFESATSNNSLSGDIGLTTTGTAVSIAGSSHVVSRVVGNASTSGTGILLSSSSSNTVANSTGISNSGMGISLSSSSNNNLTNNSGVSNTSNGIRLLSSSNNTLTNNTGSSNSTSTSVAGILLDSSNDNTLTRNIGMSNDSFGILLTSSSRNTLSNNNGTRYFQGGNIFAGIRLESSSNNNSLLNNIGTAVVSGSGILITGSTGNNLTNNTGNASNVDGISVIVNSHNNRLVNNTGTSANGFGILIQSNSNNTLTNNSGVSTSSVGLNMDVATNYVLTGSSGTSQSGFGFQQSGGSNGSSTNNTFITNTGTAMRFLSGASNNNFTDTVLRANGSWVSTDSGSNNNTFSNVTFDSLNGSIRIINRTTLPNSTTVSVPNLNTSLNNSFLNVTNLSFLNLSAQITLRGLNLTDPRPLVSFNDNGTFVACNPPRCVRHNFSGGVFIFNVSGFTTYSSNESGLVVTLTKTDNPDPVAIGSFLNYSITVNVTEGNASNVTVRETYPAQVIFNTSQPAPTSGNDTFALGNFSAPQEFIINITVNVSSNTSAGTVMNNTVNVTFLNSTDNSRSVVVTESTTAQTAECPGTITVNTTLTGNVRSNGTCVTFGASNIVLDCNGFSISYANAESGKGVFSASRNNITIRNCNISQGNSSISISNGISFEPTSNSFIINTIVNSTGSSSHGIFLDDGSRNNTVANNTVFSSGSSAGGLFLDGGLVPTSNNTIVNNTVIVSGAATNGLILQLVSNNTVTGNNVTGTSQLAIAVHTSSGNVLTNNIARSTSSFGISVQIDSFNNTLVNNTAFSASASALRLLQATNNTFHNNTGITNTGTALEFSTSAASSQNNTINGTVLQSNNTWISTDGTSSNNRLSNTTFDSVNGSILVIGNSTIPVSTSVTVSRVNTSFNRSFLNSTNLPFLNQSGQVRLRGMTFVNPQALVSFNDAAFVPCGQPQCTEISFAGGTYVFNVSSFTTYSAQEAPPNVTVAKNDSPDPVFRGLTLLYQIVLNNTGEGNATNVTVIETYPANVTFNGSQPAPTSGNTTFNIGNLSANQTFIINITVNVSNGLSNGTQLNNTVVVNSSGVSGANFTTNTSILTTVRGAPGLVTNKTDAPDPVTKGTTLAYGIFINNTGDDTAFNVTVVDNYPAGTTFNASSPSPTSGNNTFNVGALAPNQSFTINISVNVSGALSNGTILNNSYNVSFQNASGQNATVTNSTNTTVRGFPGVVTNKSDAPDPVVKGNLLNYTIQMNNTGDDTAFNVTITDNYAAGTSFVSSSPSPTSGNNVFNVGALAPNQSFLVNITLNVSTSLSNGTVLNNSYNVTFANASGQNLTASNSTLTTVVGFPVINVTKTDSPDPVTRGFQLNYSIVVNNTGDNNAFNVTVVDTYPAQVVFNNSSPVPSAGNSTFNIGNLSPNQSFTINVTVNVSNSTTNGTIINNSVNVTFVNATGQNATVTRNESTTVRGLPVIQTNKSDTPDPVVKGTLLNYSIRVNNTGDDTAFNVTVTDNYPAGLVFVSAVPSPTSGNNVFALGNLQPNQVTTINITLNVSTSISNGTVLNNTYNVTFNASSSVSFTATNSTLTTVVGFPVINVTKVDDPEPVDAGAALTYNITLRNTGDNTAFNVTVIETYPADVTFNGSQPAPTIANSTFSIGNLSPNQTFVINITVNVSASPSGLTNLVNVTFLNSTGASVLLNVNESTQITAPVAARRGGGGGGSAGAQAARSFAMTADDMTTGLGPLDTITFMVDNVKHTITVLEVSQDTVVIRVQSAPQDFRMSGGDAQEVDVDEDGVADVRVEMRTVVGRSVVLNVKLLPRDVVQEQAPVEKPVQVEQEVSPVRESEIVTESEVAEIAAPEQGESAQPIGESPGSGDAAGYSGEVNAGRGLLAGLLKVGKTAVYAALIVLVLLVVLRGGRSLFKRSDESRIDDIKKLEGELAVARKQVRQVDALFKKPRKR